MASALSTEYIGSRLDIQSYDHDPGATSATLCGPDGGTTIRYYDMKNYLRFGVMAKPTVVAAGGLTKLEIVASDATTFTNVVVIKDSGTVAADSLDDNVWLECTAAEIQQLATTYNLRYVAARLTNATSTDEVSVTYVGVPVREISGATATLIN